MSVTFTVPLKVDAPKNLREHPMARKRRVERERAAVCGCLLRQCGPDWRKMVMLPAVVIFTRCGKKLLDDDNVVGACASLRDEVARQLGCVDGPRDPITWRYQQQASFLEDYRVIVVITSAAERVA